jgi:hypothetical protein
MTTWAFAVLTPLKILWPVPALKSCLWSVLRFWPPQNERRVICALQTVRHVLNLCTSEWVDDSGETRLVHAPKIKLLREDDKKAPYPLSWQEQAFSELGPGVQVCLAFCISAGKTREWTTIKSAGELSMK